MRIRWSQEALADLQRLHAFLAPVNAQAADKAILMLSDAPDELLDYPRLGVRVPRFNDREIRHLRVGDYEMRYEVAGEILSIIRVWHGREDR